MNPAYIEQACLRELDSMLATVMDTNDDFGWEGMVVENDSTDFSLSVLGEM